MLDDADRDRMRAELLAMRNDRAVSIVITRAGAQLAAQTVRIARIARGRAFLSGQGREQRADTIAMGDVDFDVQVNDDFTHQGTLYKVMFIRPNKDFMVVAECQAVQ